MRVAVHQPPHQLFDKQREFILSKARYTLYSGAVRGGKTLALIYRALRLARPRTRGLLGAYTYPMVGDVILPKLFDVLSRYPKGSWSYQKSRHDLTIHHPAGDALIMLRHLENEEKLRGLDLNWYGVDEVTVGMTEAVFLQLNARLSAVGSSGMLATNPGAPSHWAYKFFFGASEEDRLNRHIVRARTYDNPNLPADYFEDMEKRPADWKRRFMDGEWGTMEGAVYPTFTQGEHVRKFEIDKAWEYYVFVDQGYGGPYTALFAGRDGMGRLYIFDEIYSSGILPTGRAKQIVEKAGRLGLPVNDMQAIMDTSPLSDFQIMVDALLDAGMYRPMAPNKRPGSVWSGITRVREALEPVNQGLPGIIIHERCVNTIREMESYVLTKHRDGTFTEEPVKENDHTCDALRYGVATLYRG